ncbi:hypothetical protein SAMN06265360_1103 [Haloechinothrix alba]|uniref:Uncharacterized protein n=1 Tax=Haloechinothrix alba TaxID=664784 RepID=A0A238XAI7_9PSEU|nr:hypothetical protein [Haloechinothrix alba]SNR55642.1 hypothetical protein SAMN06265360_1103 [Haloechinothrix alba]
MSGQPGGPVDPDLEFVPDDEPLPEHPDEEQHIVDDVTSDEDGYIEPPD